jgi:hypothetical protein
MSDPYDPEVARKNRRLGFILLGVVGFVVLAFIIRFNLAGLPKDREVWARMQQRASATELQDTTPTSDPRHEVLP